MKFCNKVIVFIWKFWKKYNWLLERNEFKLDIDEMFDMIFFEFSGFEIEVSICYLSDVLFGFFVDLNFFIMEVFNIKLNKSFIFRIFGLMVVIICG